MNQDGASSGLTAPNGLAQEAVLRGGLPAAPGSRPAACATSRRTARARRSATRSRCRRSRPCSAQGRAAGRHLRGRLGEDEHRPPGGGGGHRRADQGRAVARSTGRSPRACTSRRRTRYIPFDEIPLRVQQTLRRRGPAGTRRGRRRELLRLRRHERPRGARGGARAPARPPRRPSRPPISCAFRHVGRGLERAGGALRASTWRPPELSVGDVCHTATVGRSHFRHRLAAVGVLGLGPAGAPGGRRERTRDEPDAIRGEVPGGSGRKSPSCSRARPHSYAHLRRHSTCPSPPSAQPWTGAPASCDAGRTRRGWRTCWARTPRVCLTDDPTVFSLEYGLAELWASWGVRRMRSWDKGSASTRRPARPASSAWKTGCGWPSRGGGWCARTRARSRRRNLALGELAAATADVTCARPRIPLASSVTGKDRGRRSSSAPPDWLAGLDEPARLERGTEALRRGDRRFPGDPPRDLASLLASLGQLYVKGVPVDWDAFERGTGHRRWPCRPILSSGRGTGRARALRNPSRRTRPIGLQPLEPRGRIPEVVQPDAHAVHDREVQAARLPVLVALGQVVENAARL